MKILSLAQIKAWDQDYLNTHPLLDLLIDVGTRCRKWLQQQPMHNPNYIFLCGNGLNGADGLATALSLAKNNCTCHVLCMPNPSETDALKELKKAGLAHGVSFELLQTTDQIHQLPNNSVLVDALFGIGLNRAVEGFYAEVIEATNKLCCQAKISLDIPSGMSMDKPTQGPIFQADHTLNIACPKLCCFIEAQVPAVGALSIIPLDLSPTFYDALQVDDYFELKPEADQLTCLKRKSNGYKNTYGHSLMICGSIGKMGACMMSSRAAFLGGAGLVTAHVPKDQVDLIQLAVPNAMASIDPSSGYSSVLPDVQAFSSILIGCGLDTKSGAQHLLEQLLMSNTRASIVLDADALNILAKHIELQKLLDARCILTPHIGEFHRLFPTCPQDDFERIQYARAFTKLHGCHMILKGSRPKLITPDGKLYICGIGNPGMATAGMGDVLAGLITGLLAHTSNQTTACKLGLHVLNDSGNQAAIKKSQTSMTALDVLEQIPEIFLQYEAIPTSN